MKRWVSLVFMFVVFGLLLVACGNSPKDAAKKWMQAIEKGDLTEANKYSTEKTHLLNGMIVSMMDKAGKEGKKSDKDFKEGLKKIDEARVEIDGDVAKIYSSDDDSNPMTLKKVDGDWKVDVQK